MRRTILRLTVAVVLVSGLYLAFAGQDDATSTNVMGERIESFDDLVFGNEVKGDRAGVFAALRDKKVQDELGLLPGQIVALEKLTRRIPAEREPPVRESKAIPQTESSARIAQPRYKMPGALKGLERDIDSILVPEQRDRLRQVALQRRMRRMGIADALAAPDAASQLGLTEGQVDRLYEEFLEIEERYRSKLRDLETEMQREVLARFRDVQQHRGNRIIAPLMREPDDSKSDTITP